MEELIKKHEKLKALGFNVWIETLWEWIDHKAELLAKAWELDSEYRENKVTLKRDKGMRSMELKHGKEKRTDKMVEWIISDEFYDRDIHQETLATMYKLLLDKADNAQEYINVIKLNIKTYTNI